MGARPASQPAQPFRTENAAKWRQFARQTRVHGIDLGMYGVRQKDGTKNIWAERASRPASQPASQPFRTRNAAKWRQFARKARVHGIDLGMYGVRQKDGTKNIWDAIRRGDSDGSRALAKN